MMKTAREFLRAKAVPVPGIIKANRSPAWRPGQKGNPGSQEVPAEPQNGAQLDNADRSVPPQPGGEENAINGVVPSQDVGAVNKATTQEGPQSPAAEEGCSSPEVGSVVDRSRSTAHIAKFERILGAKMVDMEALRQVAWSGIPPHLRPLTWRLLLGYLPPNQERRAAVLQRKRKEYMGMSPDYSGEGRERSEEELTMLHQVQIDAPRTSPADLFFQQPEMQESLIRILYLWGLRHPASGYVQGINDLVTPFLAVFLSEHFSGPMDEWDASSISESTRMEMEADCYWCLSKLLDSIQDHYTYAQPGIQRKVFRVKELVRRIDVPLADHLETEGVEFMLFAHRWVNCLLVREVPLSMGIRLWDTYLAEIDEFGEFLVYVCAAFLLMWTPQIKQMDFQDLMMILQKMPTENWGEKEIETVLAKAFLWRTSFGNAPSHLIS